MKSTATTISITEKATMLGGRFLTKEEDLQLPANRKNAYLKEKYRKSLKTVTRFRIKDLLDEHPEWPLKAILVAILDGYNPALPPEVLLEMTRFIIAEWQKQPQPELAMA